MAVGSALERPWVIWMASLLGVASCLSVVLAPNLDWEGAWVGLGLTAAPLLAVSGTALGVQIRRRPMPDGRRGDPTPLIVGVVALVLCALFVLATIGLAANTS